MLLSVSSEISISFLLIYILAISLFYYLNNKPIKIVSLIVIWSALHSLLAYSGFYIINSGENVNRFPFILIPVFVFIFYGAFSKKGKLFYKDRSIKNSAIIHTIRIPIEIVLYYLAIEEVLPIEMTFDGRNFDILAGITAPIIVILFRYLIINKRVLLYWNIISLALVIFIMINGILSSELTYQKFGFSIANQAIAYFPFILLPAVIVPIVVYTHITDILLLINKKEN